MRLMGFACFTCSLALRMGQQQGEMEKVKLGKRQDILGAPEGEEGEAGRLLSKHVNMTSAVDKIKAARAVQETHAGEPLQLALVSGAQLCLFDNFLHYYRMHQLVAFNADTTSYKFCKERSEALADRFALYCVEPVVCHEGAACEELGNNYLNSPEYIRLTWLKPIIVQLALELEASSVLVMDIDNLQLQDFLQDIGTSDGWRIKVAENPVRHDPHEPDPNSGFIYVTQKAWDCLSGWVRVWHPVQSCVDQCEEKNEPGAPCRCWVDQDGLSAVKAANCYRMLSNETFYTNRVYKRTWENVLTVHAVAGENKVADLKAGGLWHPDTLTDKDCHYDGSYEGVVRRSD